MGMQVAVQMKHRSTVKEKKRNNRQQKWPISCSMDFVCELKLFNCCCAAHRQLKIIN